MSVSRGLAFLSLLAALIVGGTAAAVAAPQPWEWQFQPAASPVMERVENFNDYLQIVIVAIVAFVLVLLLYVIVRFNERRNPTPSRTAHNTVIEVLWTIIPVLILVSIAIPSFKLLYFADRVAKADMTIKAIGHQWYWSYEYPDNGNFTFDANIVQDADLKPGQLRLLETDNPIVLPVNTKVRLLTTSGDVIHSWAMPAFGVKLDANPGKINETWMEIAQEGTYYGQCSELCGTNHAYMPIKIEAVSKEKFAAWVADAQKKFAKADGPAPTTVAQAQPAQ